MALVEIKIDDQELKQVQRMLRRVPKAMPTVMSRAINRTASSAKTETARRISQEVKIKISDIKKGIRIIKATRGKWRAVLNILTRRIPLIAFGARQIRTGVSYRISKAGGRKKITKSPRPFIQTMQSGHTGVFRRKTTETKRLPIIQLRGPSIGSVFEKAGRIAAEVQRDAIKKLEKNIDNQVKYILSKRK